MSHLKNYFYNIAHLFEFENIIFLVFFFSLKF